MPLSGDILMRSGHLPGNLTQGVAADCGQGSFGSSDFGSRGGSSSRNADVPQKRFSALMNSQNTADGHKDEEERLL